MKFRDNANSPFDRVGLQLDRTRIARAFVDRARVHLLRICGQMRSCWPSLVNLETPSLLQCPEMKF